MITHLISREDWAAARAVGSYSPPSLASEGFIHLSDPEQVVRTASRFYAGREDLLVLWVDTERLEPELRYESPPASDPGAAERFPHLYGALALDAVVGVTPLELGPDGFRPPQPPPG
ncbi:MAG: DUF952 domain-containing protein [Planctomycetes bacterium]|nr:DUF952 domain-containing protein [Planctomycetota bacterium]